MVRVSCKSLLVALLLLFFVSSPTKARSLREAVESGKPATGKGQESRLLGHEEGANDGYGLVDMDYNSPNNKSPIHNR